MLIASLALDKDKIADRNQFMTLRTTTLTTKLRETRVTFEPSIYGLVFRESLVA